MTQEKEIMEKLDGKSMDVVDSNIEQLKEIFPDVFAEGKISFDKLQELLGNYVVEDEDHYNFTWHGKRAAGRLAQTPSTGTLRPAKDESVDWDTTQNLFIEGDNLEVLKLLQKSYHRQVKMIYIDPPYNTGNEFVYPDKFQDNLDTYLKYTGLVDDEGFKLSANTETTGRYHTNWLNMMYPRLKLARNLLKDDGVIFISIGEQEIHNLRKACDEIFGETNFIGCAGRISKKANNQGDYWAPNFDYVLTYSKNIDCCTPFFGGINYNNYTEIETDGPRKGEKYQLIRLYMTSLDPMRGCNNQRYFVECPDGSFVIPPGENFPEKREDAAFLPPKSGKDKVWRWSYKSYLEKKDRIVVKKVRSSNLVNQDGEKTLWNVYVKTYLKDVINNSTSTPNNFIEDHINQNASHELKVLDIPFDFAKPSSLIKFLSETCRVEKNDTIIDFFSGSASTADAVMQLNSKDNGNRKYIMVQLPEITNEDSDEHKAGYKTISDIGKERIRRAAKKITEENPDYEGDLGFKTFKLDSSNIKSWDADFDTLEEDLMSAVDYIKPDRSSEDILYELLLKYGLDLTVPIETRTIAGKNVYSIGLGALIVCLDKDITMEVVNGIGALKEELQPEIMRVVFKDESFKDDVVKTNALQTLKRSGIEDIKSL